MNDPMADTERRQKEKELEETAQLNDERSDGGY